MTATRFPRTLLKLSGEALAGDKGFGFEYEVLERLADEVKDVVAMGVALGLVIGGGNIVRGGQLAKMGMERVGADYMGMLGTVINALA
ncbi:MAG: UMP kinase, partial [Gemmatimonadota bacterium]|nr:UMP kinase [Gemmatimonadota bacterium]